MTTNNRDDKFWLSAADEMQRALQLRPLDEEEAAREYAEATDAPLTDDEIEAAMEIVKARIPREPSYEERTDRPAGFAEMDKEVGEVCGMHRNEGEVDPEVEEEMRRQREAASEDDAETDADDDKP